MAGVCVQLERLILTNGIMVLAVYHWTFHTKEQRVLVVKVRNRHAYSDNRVEDTGSSFSQFPLIGLYGPQLLSGSGVTVWGTNVHCA